MIPNGQNPVFEFHVYLEENTAKIDPETGKVVSTRKLVPYAYGPYYLIKKEGNIVHYYKLTGENNAPVDQGTTPVVCSTTGRSGSINSIPPEFTIEIPNLTAGTHFYIEERLDNIPEGYTYDHEELTPGTYGDPHDELGNDGAIVQIFARDETQIPQPFDLNTVGRIIKDHDAESHVYNRIGKELEVEKVWDSPAVAGTVTVELKFRKRLTNPNGEWSDYAYVKDNQGSDKIFDSSITTSLVLDAGNDWKGSFIGLPETYTDANGVWELDYSAEETAITVSGENILDKYTVTVNKVDAEEDSTKSSAGTVTIHNKKKPERGTIHVEKKWFDADGNEVTSTTTETSISYDIYRVKHVHEWDMENQVVDRQPTDTETGEGHYNCKHYGCNAQFPVTIPSLGCEMGEWTVTTNATCTENGERTRVCKNNSAHVETEPIPATGHTPGTWEIITQAGCETTGLRVRKCTVCGTEIESDTIPATGHDWDEGVVTKEATEEEEGIRTYTCKNDASHKKTEVIEKVQSEIIVNYHIRSMYNDNYSFTVNEYGPDGSITVKAGGRIKVSYYRSYDNKNEQYSYGNSKQSIPHDPTAHGQYIPYELELDVIDGIDLTLYLESNFGQYNFKIEAIAPSTKNLALRRLSVPKKAPTQVTASATSLAELNEKINRVGYTEGGVEHKYYVVEKYNETTESLGKTDGWKKSYTVDLTDDDGNVWSYYFVETSPDPEGGDYDVSYDNQGIGKDGTTTIKNKEITKGFDILKVDATNHDTTLSGVVFTARRLVDNPKTLGNDVEYADDESKKITSNPTDAEGRTSINNLIRGIYEIQETTLHAGYVLTGDGKFYVKIDASGVKLLRKDVSKKPAEWTEAETDGMVCGFVAASGSQPAMATVGNTPGVALPSTGGPGTNLLYLLGSLMLALGSAGFVMRKRRRVG